MAFSGKEVPLKPGQELRFTTLKVRIYPTAAQTTVIEKTFDCCRFLWNRMLSDQEEFYAATDRSFIPRPASYKKDHPFLKEADSFALSYVHQDLTYAFNNFFRHPEQFRHPVFKKKKDSRRTYTTYCHHYQGKTPDSIRIEGNGIVLPKLKWVKARLHRRPMHWWTLQYAVVSRSISGNYYCSLVYKFPVKQEVQRSVEAETTVGLKYSYRHFYVDSTGFMADPPRWAKESGEKLKRLQRKLSRMERGSKNYDEILSKYRQLSEHIANQRRDYIHKESRRIANAWDAVCVRSDDFVALSQSVKQVNILDSGFGMFRNCLDYKLRRAGKTLILVEKNVPTTKLCYVCGSINENVDRGKKFWTCPSCGTRLAREINSAINIKLQGIAQEGIKNGTAA